MTAPAPGAGRFPRAGRWRSGYQTDQVDAFLDDVERTLATPGLRLPPPADIRRAGFDLVRNGYEPHAVDAALDRLEQRALEDDDGYGAAAEADRLAGEVAAVRAELAQPHGSRFPRAGRFERGYAVRDVDQFCEGVAAVLAGGRGPGVRAVRSAVFRPQRGGYAELPVDDLLDRVVDVLLRRATTGS